MNIEIKSLIWIKEENEINSFYALGYAGFIFMLFLTKDGWRLKTSNINNNFETIEQAKTAAEDVNKTFIMSDYALLKCWVKE